ncbi:uncharacterized protein [Antennarius striatus]|uniref:uncharacterized protein isoform X2 n=1 Tax=Antennarius striatus TaxID=241820 RepID=UPI0035B3B0E0
MGGGRSSKGGLEFTPLFGMVGQERMNQRGQNTMRTAVKRLSFDMLAEMEMMAYITEIRLGGDRGTWTTAAPSSCPEVDLEVIEEYLQEHSLEVQSTHAPLLPPTTAGQQTHAHQGTKITVNSWLGQYPYEWHCGSHTPNEEYGDRDMSSTWASSHDNQWDCVTYSYEEPVYIDSDSQSSGSQYLEYQDSPSPLSDRGTGTDRDSRPLAPLSGPHTNAHTCLILACIHTPISHHHLIFRLTSSFAGKRKERLFQFLFEMLQTPSMRSCIWWVQSSAGTFQFSSQNKEHLAQLWGRRKGNRKTMTYQKMARALRNYSRTGEIQKVKRKLTYRFNEKTLRGLRGDSTNA